MKELFTYFIQFAIAYGVKDKEKFREYISEWLEPYALEEKAQEKFIDFSYEFFTGWTERMQQTNIIAGGVKKGNSDLEKRLEELAEKLEAILKKMPQEKQ